MEVEIKRITCCSCGVLFWVGESHYNELKEKHTTFYCPNGHPQHFVAETDAEKFRKLYNEALGDKINIRNKLEKEIRNLKGKKKGKK
jgi:RNase P subunit RPR2